MSNILIKKTTMPFGVYRIDKNCISFLKRKDKNIPDPNITDRYCGPVFGVNAKCGVLNYFVPILPDYENFITDEFSVEPTFENGILFGFIDAGKAVPCIEEYLTKDDSDELLSQICIDMRSFIIDRTMQIREMLFLKDPQNENFDDTYAETDISAGLYSIDEDHIEQLRQKNSNILSPEYINYYYGPVFCRDTKQGRFNYFVPVYTAFDTIEYLWICFVGNDISKFINADEIIPCPKKRCKCVIPFKHLYDFYYRKNDAEYEKQFPIYIDDSENMYRVLHPKYKFKRTLENDLMLLKYLLESGEKDSCIDTDSNLGRLRQELQKYGLNFTSYPTIEELANNIRLMGIAKFYQE